MHFYVSREDNGRLRQLGEIQADDGAEALWKAQARWAGSALLVLPTVYRQYSPSEHALPEMGAIRVVSAHVQDTVRWLRCHGLSAEIMEDTENG